MTIERKKERAGQIDKCTTTRKRVPSGLRGEVAGAVKPSLQQPTIYKQSTKNNGYSDPRIRTVLVWGVYLFGLILARSPRFARFKFAGTLPGGRHNLSSLPTFPTFIG